MRAPKILHVTGRLRQNAPEFSHSFGFKSTHADVQLGQRICPNKLEERLYILDALEVAIRKPKLADGRTCANRVNQILKQQRREPQMAQFQLDELRIITKLDHVADRVHCELSDFVLANSERTELTTGCDQACLVIVTDAVVDES